MRIRPLHRALLEMLLVFNHRPPKGIPFIAVLKISENSSGNISYGVCFL